MTFTSPLSSIRLPASVLQEHSDKGMGNYSTSVSKSPRGVSKTVVTTLCSTFSTSQYLCLHFGTDDLDGDLSGGCTVTLLILVSEGGDLSLFVLYRIPVSLNRNMKKIRNFL